MINLANHHTSIDSSTYAPTIGFKSYYRSRKKPILWPLKAKNINDSPMSQSVNRKVALANITFLHNFKIKSLLCWRSDIWYLNLRCGFLNCISACHMIWTTVKNNGKVAFVHVGGPQDEKAHLSLIDLGVKTQIQPKAVPRLNTTEIAGLFNKVSLFNKQPVVASRDSISENGSTVDYKQQKKKKKPLSLLELCSLLKNVALTTKKSKAKHTKQNLEHKKCTYTKLAFFKESDSEMCQSKINVLKSRLNLITYADETAPSKGYFSNSDATFKSQNHLLPHSNRKSKLLLKKANFRFKNCKRFYLTPLDLSKSFLSVYDNNLTLVKHKDKHKHHSVMTRTYVQDRNETMLKQQMFNTNSKHKNVNKLTPADCLAVQLNYRVRYYSKVNPMIFKRKVNPMSFKQKVNPMTFKLSFGLNFSKAFGKSQPKNLFRLKNHKSIKPIGFSNNSVVLQPMANGHINHNQYGVKPLLKRPFKSSQHSKKWFWIKPKTHQPHTKVETTPYCQPYWTGTNVYKEMYFANNVNSAKHFASSPFIRGANVVVFSHPEKVLGLVNQIRNLRLPTIGFVSGSNKLEHQTANIVDFHILGNPENVNFVMCALQNFNHMLSMVCKNR